MATDATGGTTAAKLQLDSKGFPITAGGARITPYINGDYDLWLFPTAAEADANDTTSAIQFADNVNADPKDGDRTIAQDDNRYGPIFATVAAMTAANPVSVDGVVVDLVAGMSIETQGYTTAAGDGGGARYLIQTAAEFGGTPDGYGDHTLANGNVAVLQYSGAVNVNWLGIFGDGATDVTSAIKAAVTKYAHTYYPGGTYVLGNLAFTGLFNRRMTGDGKNTTLFDFKNVASGTGFYIGFDVPNGGCQRWTVEGIGLTDSRGVSTMGTALKLESGPTGQSPAQTVGFFAFNDCALWKFENQSGIGKHLLNVSHVTFNDWEDGFDLDCGESLVMENSISINTGVFVFNNCRTQAAIRPLRITATQLIDSITFNGGYISNFTGSAARECLLIDGTAPTAALEFHGTHWECRDDTENAIISVTGQWSGGSLDGNHFSGGTVSKQVKYLFSATGSAVVKALDFGANESLRVKDKASAGFLFHFDNTVVTDILSPLNIGTWFRNTTVPNMLDITAGGNEEVIRKSINSVPDTDSRLASGNLAVYELPQSATPSVKGGKVFEVNSAWTGGTITDFVDEYFGQDILIINNTGGSITVQNDGFKIRCKGAVNLTITNNDTVRFTRTSATHWIQSSELIST
jgi:hypothetical protein